MRGPIFICGSGRSGTTILAETLGLLPSIFTFPDETRILVDGHGGLLDWMNAPDSRYLADAFRRRVGTGFAVREVVRDLIGMRLTASPASMTRQLLLGNFYTRRNADAGRDVGLCSAISERHFREAVARFFTSFPSSDAGNRYRQVSEFITDLFSEPLNRTRKRRWCDSTPASVLHMVDLQLVFPDARFIHVIRDGRDVAASFARRGWVPSVEHGLRWWFQMVTTGRRLGRALPTESYLEVQFDVLAVRPREELERILAFLGERPSHELERHSIRAERAAQHRREITPSAERLFRILGGDLTEEFGWPLR